jgi:hypothetical protein
MQRHKLGVDIGDIEDRQLSERVEFENVRCCADARPSDP